MKHTLFNILLALSLALAPAGVFSGLASAACSSPAGFDAKAQVLTGVQQTPNGACSDTGVQNTFGVVVNIMSLVLGGLAVVMIILSGFKYVTAGGDSNKIGSAKSTLIYALVGLAIAALSQLLIHFVIGQTGRINQ